MSGVRKAHMIRPHSLKTTAGRRGAGEGGMGGRGLLVLLSSTKSATLIDSFLRDVCVKVTIPFCFFLLGFFF